MFVKKKKKPIKLKYGENKMKKQKFVEEFEDKIIDWDDHILLETINTYLIDLFIKYELINKKVKISAKKGKIVIEEI